MIIQQNEPEFPGEVIDFRAGAEKLQNNPRVTCGAIMWKSFFFNKDIIKNWNGGADLKELHMAKSVTI